MSISLPASVDWAQTPGGLRYLSIEHPRVSARIFEQGAHITHFQPRDRAPMLWVSGAEPYQPGAAIRGGIPVCWPWFGAHPTGQGPAHGLVRNRSWTLKSAIETGQGVELSFRISLSEPDWCGLSAELTIGLADALTLTLTSVNAGDNPLIIGSALHSYFAIGDIHHTRLYGMKGRRYLDQLQPGAGVQLARAEPLAFQAETDRIYYGAENWRIEGQALSVEINSTGSNSSVVWNPWREKSARLSHFNADDYLAMLCVETANCGDDCRHLAPGESHSLGVSYRYL